MFGGRRWRWTARVGWWWPGASRWTAIGKSSIAGYTPGQQGAGRPLVRYRSPDARPGCDFQVVAATDSTGTVWLAWQAWRKDNFDILLAALADGHPWKEPRVVSDSKANDWSPAIAADSKGNVYVAWDTYDKGNYDVRLRVSRQGGEDVDRSRHREVRGPAEPGL